MSLEFIRYACSSVAILGPTLKVRTMHRKHTSLVQGDMGDLCRQTCAQHKATYFALQKCQYLIPLLPDDKGIVKLSCCEASDVPSGVEVLSPGQDNRRSALHLLARVLGLERLCCMCGLRGSFKFWRNKAETGMASHGTFQESQCY